MGEFVVKHFTRYRSAPTTNRPYYLSEAIWRYNARSIPHELWSRN